VNENIKGKGFDSRTMNERRQLAKKAGKASGKARREKKAMRENLETILTMTLKSGKLADIDSVQNFAALAGKNITVQDAILIKQTQKAMMGDTRAAEFVRDLSGNKPENTLNIDGKVPVIISGEDELK
jgi:hypothetical protein